MQCDVSIPYSQYFCKVTTVISDCETGFHALHHLTKFQLKPCCIVFPGSLSKHIEMVKYRVAKWQDELLNNAGIFIEPINE